VERYSPSFIAWIGRLIESVLDRASNRKRPPISSLRFRLIFAYPVYMPSDAARWRDFVIRCKGCGENIPAPVETLPASWIATRCPLCGEDRSYLPTEVFSGRVSFAFMRKPVRSAEQR
jgi:hypothetical protein